MGKTGKWLKIFLVGPKKNEKSSEKEKTKNRGDLLSVPSATGNPTTPAAVTASTPKEKRRWSFRRSSVTSPATPLKGSTSAEESNGGGGGNAMLSASIEFESEQKKHALAVAAAADAAAVAAEAAAAVIRLTAATRSRINPLEEEAGVKIQSAFRSYLARKALGALRGVVKLQALVRGHLVRKQAMATLRCMHALVTVQDRARVQRLRMVEDSKSLNPRPSTPRKSTQYDRFRHIINHEVEADKVMEENIKIVEMDIGHSKATGTGGTQQVSQAPSALTELSPRTCSGHFEDYNYCFGVAQRSPQCYSAQPRLEATRIPFSTYSRSNYAESESESYDYPSYMANTESSRAKARSQSAPKQRAPESFERQPSSRRRPSVEGRNLNNNNNIPRTVRMQRSSSHVGSAVHNYQYPWSVNLDKSSMSLKDSECGSTSTVLTNNNYCRSLVSYSMNGSRNMSLPFPFPPHPHPHPHLPPRHAV